MQENQKSALENAFHELNKKKEPLVWTFAKDSLSDKIVSLSQDSIEINSLKNSIKTLGSELEEYDMEESPKKWAYAQYNLATNLHFLGLQDQEGMEYLNDSVEAYKKVLTVWKRPEVPLDWATTMNKLGMVFQAQGNLTKDAHTLKISISAFNNALTALTQEQVPLDWAVTYNNLGVSIHLIGEILQDAAMIKDSIESFENALQIVTSNNNPVGWLIVMANIAEARKTLAKQVNDLGIANEALSNLESLIKYITESSNTDYLGLVKEEKEKFVKLQESVS